MTVLRTFPIRLHLLLFSLLVLAPTLCMTGVITFRYAQSARRTIEEAAQDKAADFQRALDRRVDVAIASLEAVATSPAIAARDWPALRAQVEKIPTLAAGTVGLYGEGDEALWTSRGLGGDERGEAVRAVWQTAPGDDTRREVAISGVQTVAGHQGFIRVVVPAGSGGASRPLLAWTMDAAVLSGDFPPLDPQWLGVAVDRDYRVIVRSRDNAAFVGRQASTEFSRQLVASAGTLASRTLDGMAVFTAYRRSPLTGWVALVSVPQTVLSRPLGALWWTLGALILTGAVVSAAAAYVYSRYLGRDLRSLSADAAAVASERRLPPASSRVREVAAVHRAMIDASGRIAEGRAQQRVLLAELNHRVKNTLAVIQTLIGRTVTAGRSPEEATAALRGRVGALAAAHDALSDSEWHDPDLLHVVARVLGARVSMVRISGPAIVLRPRTVVAVSQALYEVVSHSLGSGAMRRGDQPALDWTWADGSLALTWTDPAGADGPAAAPADFAATVIQLCIERQLGGRVSALTTADALVMTWTIPARTDLGYNLSPACEGEAVDSVQVEAASSRAGKGDARHGDARAG
jgi:two-component sensor histidine kinase